MVSKPEKKTKKKKVSPREPGTTKSGRPPLYKTIYPEQAFRLCLLYRCTNEVLAEKFKVSVDAIKLWLKKYPAFRDAVRRGREDADFDVVQALHERAKGFRYIDRIPTKVRAYDTEGRIIEKVVVTTVEKVIPPCPVSAKFWLENRAKEEWRSKPDLETDDGYVQPVKIEIGIVDARVAKPDAAK